MVRPRLLNGMKMTDHHQLKRRPKSDSHEYFMCTQSAEPKYRAIRPAIYSSLHDELLLSMCAKPAGVDHYRNWFANLRISVSNLTGVGKDVNIF